MVDKVSIVTSGEHNLFVLEEGNAEIISDFNLLVVVLEFDHTVIVVPDFLYILHLFIILTLQIHFRTDHQFETHLRVTLSKQWLISTATRENYYFLNVHCFALLQKVRLFLNLFQILFKIVHSSNLGRNRDSLCVFGPYFAIVIKSIICSFE